MGDGPDGTVFALTFYRGELVVGGWFGSADGVAASHVARWDGKQWRAFGVGVNNIVLALAVYGTDLIAARQFNTAGGNPANYISRWDGTNWYPLAGGLTGGGSTYVSSLAVYRGELVASGQFSVAGSESASYVARWNGQQWRSFPERLGSGGTLFVFEDDLIMNAGLLNGTGGYVSQAARWDGQHWQPMGGHAVSALSVFKGELIAATFFQNTQNVWEHSIGRWDGTNWVPLTDGVSNGMYVNEIRALAAFGGDLFAAGTFSSAGPILAKNIARWDGSRWNQVGRGTDNKIHVLAVFSMTARVCIESPISSRGDGL